MKIMNLVSLFLYVTFFSLSFSSQNIVLHSSDEKLIEVQAHLVETSPKLSEALKNTDTSTVTIKVPSKGILIERLIAFSASESLCGQGSKNMFGDLVSYLTLFCKVDLPAHFSKNSFIALNDRVSRRLTEKIIAQIQHDHFPATSLNMVALKIVAELSEQMNLAELFGNLELKERLTHIRAGILSYLETSIGIYLLPFVRSSTLPKDTKVAVVKSVTNFLSTKAICDFLELISDENVSASIIENVLNTFDHVTLHHLLYLLESSFEPKIVRNLRAQDVGSVSMNRKRLKQIAFCEDQTIRKIRTFLIAKLANNLVPKVTNMDLVNLVVLSSLPTHTIAEILCLVIEKYPGLLLEFVGLYRINWHRECQNRPPLEVLQGISQMNPFRKILSQLQQRHPYFSADQLYTSLKIAFDTAYLI